MRDTIILKLAIAVIDGVVKIFSQRKCEMRKAKRKAKKDARARKRELNK